MCPHRRGGRSLLERLKAGWTAAIAAPIQRTSQRTEDQRELDPVSPRGEDPPWDEYWDEETGQSYWYNPGTGESTFERPPDADGGAAAAAEYGSDYEGGAEYGSDYDATYYGSDYDTDAASNAYDSGYGSTAEGGTGGVQLQQSVRSPPTIEGAAAAEGGEDAADESSASSSHLAGGGDPPIVVQGRRIDRELL